MDGSLASFAASVAGIDDSRHLWRAARAFLRARGVVRMSYHHQSVVTPESAVVVAEGFPKDWVRHYVEHELSLADPITALAAKRSQPFFWSDVDMLTTLTGTEAAFLCELETAELGDGLAMQVYGPNMRSAYVGLGFGPGLRPDLAPAGVFELKAAVQIAHLRFCEITEHRTALERDLSPREEEILGWIARGKSNGVIASILGLSRHTVDTLVRRLFDKLGVADRTTAVIRGLGAGVIDLSGPARVARMGDMP
ncbi:LuxR family transcriptional regulator [Jannaschia sp. Os4]|uniref:helix-turn-helix transcriptional regulator n=1 Tax=Jannaschia sp. Os4 TaxID=2807617 RepID=UPI00193A6B6F|nr:LuxR family transcriptional regulator [Jannaschia sp. Os4]MBM2576858.1 LuxR family transcriptional regulator [Jannaschia sp. Os4]